MIGMLLFRPNIGLERLRKSKHQRRLFALVTTAESHNWWDHTDIPCHNFVVGPRSEGLHMIDVRRHTSQSASSRSPHSMTLVLAGFLRCRLKALVAAPPTGCVPNVFLYRILSAFSSFTNSLRAQASTALCQQYGSLPESSPLPYKLPRVPQGLP